MDMGGAAAAGDLRMAALLAERRRERKVAEAREARRAAKRRERKAHRAARRRAREERRGRRTRRDGEAILCPLSSRRCTERTRPSEGACMMPSPRRVQSRPV